MFITFIINLEYMDYESRMKWYLKNLLFCSEHGGVCITHQNLINNFLTYQKGVDERFLSEFEIEYFKEEKFKNIKQYAIEDSLFSDIEKEQGGRTGAISYLLQNDDDKLYQRLKAIFCNIGEDYPEQKIEMAFHCLDAFKSFKRVCKQFNVPLISYTFSCFRKVHGYKQTLFIAAIDKDVYCTDDCRVRYDRFLKEENHLPLLCHEELIALLGKTRTLPLTLFIDKEPSYEIAICGEAYAFVPCAFFKHLYDDDDINYYVNQIFNQKQIRTRQHPYLLSHMQVPREGLMQDDPAAFILSCRRVTSFASQIMLKALLWKRTAIMPKDTLPLSFMCATRFDDIKEPDLSFLNYYLFCYTVPSSLMFNAEYWLWRLSNPKETDIYHRHLTEISKNVKCDQSILNSRTNRYWNILATREDDKSTVQNLKTFKLSDKIDWNACTSKVILKYPDQQDETIWIANNFEEEDIISSFQFDGSPTPQQILFFAIDDRAAYIIITAISINGTIIEFESQYRYTPKHSHSAILNSNMIKEKDNITRWLN